MDVSKANEDVVDLRFELEVESIEEEAEQKTQVPRTITPLYLFERSYGSWN